MLWLYGWNFALDGGINEKDISGNITLFADILNLFIGN